MYLFVFVRWCARLQGYRATGYLCIWFSISTIHSMLCTCHYYHFNQVDISKYHVYEAPVIAAMHGAAATFCFVYEKFERTNTIGSFSDGHVGRNRLPFMRSKMFSEAEWREIERESNMKYWFLWDEAIIEMRATRLCQIFIVELSYPIICFVL